MAPFFVSSLNHLFVYSMLQKLRDQTQNTGFKILVVAIIIVLTLFGFGATNMFLGPDPQVAKVGNYEITQSLLNVETEREKRRLLGRMGPDFDPSSIDQLQLQQYALQQLISRQVLIQSATGMGLATPEDAVNEELINAPAYQLDGTFNEAIYRQQVQALGYSPVDFVAEFGALMTSEQLRQGVMDSTALADWELAEIVRVINQRRDLAYLPLTIDLFMDQVDVSEEEVATRYEENAGDYMTELKVDASYLSLKVDDLQNDPSIEVEESQLTQLYEEQREQALGSEQRDSSHILVQINGERTEQQALDAITEIRDRLKGGADFAALAEEASEDPGSAAEGGSLGPVGKGIFDPAFEQALWALSEVGETSEPVLSSFGYHIIRLDEIVLPEYPPFEEQRDQLEEEVRRSHALDLFADRVLELERSVYDERSSLSGSAQALVLSIVQAEGVSRSEPGEDSLMGEQGVLDALFSDEVLAGDNSEPVELMGGEQVVVVRVDQQYPPEPIPLEDVAAQIREQILREKARAAIDVAQADGMARLAAGDPVGDIADSLGSAWRSFEGAGRIAQNVQIPQQVLSAAFDLPRPTAGEKSVGSTELDDGAALITVTRVLQGDINTTTDVELNQMRGMAEGRVSRMDFSAFYRAAQEALGVDQPAG